MPELPEVEHARATLGRYLRGQPLVRVRAERGRPNLTPPPALVKALRGARAGRAERRGKQILLPLQDARGRRFGLALHLGMTGRIVVVPPGCGAPPHARLSLTRADGLTVHLRDPRRFGRVALSDAACIGELPEAAALGIDPSQDPWGAGPLAAALLGTRRVIKEVLLDQRRIAGIGNIYAAEALWRARLHPARRADALTQRELGTLARCLSRVLEASLESFRRGLRRRGAGLARGDERAFLEPLYMSEGGRNPFAVYGRQGEACRRCGQALRSARIGGRGTVWCEGCQR